jgi:hypothetical protein
MRCGKCDADLSDTAKFCSECGAAVPQQAPSIHVSGGGYFAGPVHAGHNVVGEVTGNVTSGLAGEDLARFADLFRGVYAQIDAHTANDPAADPELLRDTAQQVEREVAKGEDADPGRLERALNTLARLAPEVLDLAVNAITNPAAAVVGAVRMVAERFRERAE